MASSAALVVPADVFISAARVTAAYAILFVSLLVWQGISKLQLAKAAQAKKEPFDRQAFVCTPNQTTHSVCI